MGMRRVLLMGTAALSFLALALVAIQVTAASPVAVPGSAAPVGTGLLQATQNPGWVGDWVWYDADGDGVQDAGEMGLPGVVVTLTRASGPPLTATTDAGGVYSFTNLAVSQRYTVTLAPVTGYTPTAASVHSTYLTAAEPANLALDFGLRSTVLQAIKVRPHGDICATWNFWYYIFISNTTGITLNNLTVTDSLPYGIGAYSVQTGIGQPYTGRPGGYFDPAKMVCTWTLGILQPYSTTAVWIRARTLSWLAGFTLTNTAQVAVDELGVPLPLMDAACVRTCPPITATPTATPTPTVTPTPRITTTVTIQKGTFGNSEDTHIYRYGADSNYSSEPLLKVGYKQVYAGILRFDLAPIPAAATVDTATLQVYGAGWGGADITMGAYAISRTMTISQTTWNVARTGNPWGAPGCNSIAADRRPVPEAVLTTSGPSKWYSFDLTALVQAWVNGSAPNNGVLLRAEFSPYSFLLGSNENSSMGQRPKLVVTYR